ncbi:LOT5 [Candida jiufengensis]|uniref:LOT5 n=1 Tax=Candida jiufengensis TaxID=497108 RepID=UPI0022246B75|nr:LOT5 [Candida jiufengensis]KAI5955615.1 LOT5 [Candida jiufengensis]
MPPPIKYINEEPNIENTILYQTYQSSSPERFSVDNDKFIMYEGGSYSLTFKNSQQHLPKLNSNQVSIYVLSSCFIIWSNDDNIGIEIPYQLIYLHALNKNSLYLQVQNISLLPDDILEIQLSPRESSSNNELFHKVNGSPESIYQAMSKCSAMHYDSENEEQNHIDEETADGELPTLEIPEHWLQEVHFKNEGNADDLDEDIEQNENNNDEIIAGMNVDIGYSQIAGNKRNDNEYDIVHNKKNKLY